MMYDSLDLKFKKIMKLKQELKEIKEEYQVKNPASEKKGQRQVSNPDIRRPVPVAHNYESNLLHESNNNITPSSVVGVNFAEKRRKN